jgi:hypothetical protein
VVCGRGSVNVALFIEHFPTSEENAAVAEKARLRYAPLAKEYGLRIDDWHGSSATTKRDRIITRLDTGYENGNSSEVAQKAAEILTAWVRMLTEHPLGGNGVNV